MRRSLLALTLVGGLWAIPVQPAGDQTGALLLAPIGGAAVIHAQEAPNPPQPPPARVDIQVNHGRGWYASPVWIAIGAIAIVLLIVLLVMASRDGGTTAVR